MKLFNTKQISKIDKYTIENEPISSLDLMERASTNLANYFVNNFSRQQAFCFVCGFGNNGGDGLATARLLFSKGYKVRVLLFAAPEKQSPENKINYQRCVELGIEHTQSTKIDDFKFNSDEIIVDALFGNGLNRPLEGDVVSIIKKINNSKNTVISIDVPSGLMGEDNTNNINENIIKANKTLALEFPKLSFFFPENEIYVGDFEIIPIYLHEEIKKTEPSRYFFLDKQLANQFIKKRSKFAEKRAFGHSLLYAGNIGKMGAAILASKTAIRSGAGLITTLIPEGSSQILQTAIPEVMVKEYSKTFDFSNTEFKHYTAIALGPGIGVNEDSLNNLKSIIQFANIPLIIDADAITLLSQNKHLLKELPDNTIITPHIREFDRLFGQHQSHYSRFLTAQKMAQEFKIIIILKGAYTQIHLPNGEVYFNSTGNPGMATGGSGDVLTGILLGLLSQNFIPQYAALLGVYIHGLAGDLALKKQSYESLIASDIIKNLGKAFRQTYN